jgi:CubicO group peptidase (beta-lactamase class C family)
MTLRHALRQRVLAPLGLERTDFVEGPLRDDCAWGYLPADNPILPGRSEPRDVTEIDVPFHGAGGGVVSTAGEIARTLRALLGGELVPDHLRAEMLQAVDSDWPETDPVRARHRRDHGSDAKAAIAVWGRVGPLGFSAGYTAIALSSEDGERQVVLCVNGVFAFEEAEEAFFVAAGRLVWRLYCI